ncbi:hypothetical protein K435DRAFT_838891, partial [Dendrothele bispora CBS 962.96]
MATHTRAPYPSTPSPPPSSLTGYLTQHRPELKKRVEKAREAYRKDKESQENCRNYLENNNDYEYNEKWQKGLVPKALVEAGHYNKSDTVFTEFEKHYPEAYILSKSKSSYIIGNKASYDTRQYTAEWDPSGQDKTTAAGMSYLHLLIIPREKVYNVVQLENTEIIREMITHFQRFWKDPTAVERVNNRIELAIQERNEEVVKHLKKDSNSFPERRKAWDAVMEGVELYRKECAEKLHKLTVGFILEQMPAFTTCTCMCSRLLPNSGDIARQVMTAKQFRP